MKEGRRQKGEEIIDGFNREKAPLSGRAMARAKREARLKVLADKAAALEKEKRIAALTDRLADLKVKAGYVSDAPQEALPEEDDEKSAYQMLQDMRWVYRQVKGRTKLKALVEGDDRQFVTMVKELMKIEIAIMAAKMKKGEEGSGTNQNFFVVLKGLDADKAVLEMVDKDVDMKQVGRALNPDGSDLNG